MFYYVIYNSTVLNYSLSNKNLNTFIYGTVLYILLHGLINSYNNQFAYYIKSYFWVILAIDIFSIYYMYNYLGQDAESESNTIKSLLDTFYKKIPTKEEQNDNEDNKNNKNNKNKKNKKNIEKEDNEEPLYTSSDDTNENLLPQDFDPSESLNDEIGENNSDQMSDAGSDIDLDKFEMSLQD
jgi:hypothetical protein